MTEPCVARLAKELGEESGRVPPEARADLALTQVFLTRRSVPDEDPERTLLQWLSDRGFHDVLALRSDVDFEVRGVAAAAEMDRDGQQREGWTAENVPGGEERSRRCKRCALNGNCLIGRQTALLSP